MVYQTLMVVLKMEGLAAVVSLKNIPNTAELLGDRGGVRPVSASSESSVRVLTLQKRLAL